MRSEYIQLHVSGSYGKVSREGLRGIVVTHTNCYVRLQLACPFASVDLLTCSRRAQVYKAVRGGVQDVAIKIMHEADDEQLAQFEKVCASLESSVQQPQSCTALS